MIIAFSDLHLECDRAMHPAIAARLFAELRRVCASASARGVRHIEMLLLGDILELLKTSLWLSNGSGPQLKPWDRDRAEDLSAAVASVVEAIYRANEEIFFAPLRKLLMEFPATLQYVYGNHDALLRTHGAKAREFLAGRFPELRFVAGSTWIDEDHEAVAKHGHEWDRYNRVHSDTISPFGDAMVVELVSSLPALVEAAESPHLAFLREMDDVRPQTPKALAQWLEWNIGRLPANQDAVRHQVNQALRTAAEALASLPAHKFSKEAGFSRVQKAALRAGPPLKVMSTIPEWIEESPDYGNLASGHLEQTGCRFLLCGHTHLPEHQPLALTSEPERDPVYCNTGTWRRVHARVNGSDGLSHFHALTEGCLVVLWSRRERKDLQTPAYEFVRCSNGF